MSSLHRKTPDLTLITLHGLGGAPEWMVPLVQSLTTRHPFGRTLEIALPGHGGAPMPPKGARLFEELSAHSAFVASEPYVLVAHSIATGVLPHLLKRGRQPPLLLVGLEGNIDLGDCKLSRELARYSPEAFDGHMKKLQRFGDLALGNALATRPGAEAVRRYADAYRNVEARAMRELACEIVELAETGALADAITNFPQAALLLRGERSPPISLSGPNITVRTVTNAGHLLMLDQPDAIADLVAQTLTTIEKRKTGT